jgi:hypothetical protein
VRRYYDDDDDDDDKTTAQYRITEIDIMDKQ